MRKVLGSSIFHLNIEEVCTGVDAVVRFNSEAFDVVFLDVNNASVWMATQRLRN